MNRRTFLKAGAVAAGTPLFSGAAAGQATGAKPPSDRIRMGLIGCGNMGTGDLKDFLKDERVQVTAVCDVNRETPGYWDGNIAGWEPARQFVEWHYARQKRSGIYKGCTAYQDFRQLLARQDIDAVAIALPDHWHGLAVVAACKAGKDIYGQKPLSLTIAQGRIMSDAVKKYGRVFQTGSQQRSDARFRKACELVRNGRIGKVKAVLVGLPGGVPDFGETGDRKETEPVPEGFDYAMWLGPAPEAPYCPARCFVNFRWNFDYSGGQITDWGAHHIDIAQLGLGTANTGPVEIHKGPAEFSSDKVWNTATAFRFEARYANGVDLIVSSTQRMGVTFEGTDGWIWVTRGNMESSPKSLIDSEVGADEFHLPVSDDHHRNFIDCVYSRAEPVAPIEQAHRTISIAHLGNIALRLNRDLRWDPDSERIQGDDEASKMLSRPMREPWKLEL
jgi:myo-inositol 2-dehydrogenase/D-chiro-inositol 1-dehydrogenase